MFMYDWDGNGYECPGCGLAGLAGPFEAPDGVYYECQDCERHVQLNELKGH